MNKTSAVLGWVVALIVVIGLIFYFVGRSANVNPAYPATPVTTTAVSVAPAPVATLQPGIPTIVADTTAVTSDTTAIESARIVPNGALTTYWYEYGTSPSFGSRTTTQTAGSGYAAIPVPGYITGLAPNTTYYIGLVAENKYGTVDGSQYTFQTTQGNPPPVGGIPVAQTIAATTVSRTAATVNAQVTPNGADTSYWFEYGETTDLGSTTAFSSIGNGTAPVPASVSLSGLYPLTTYYFRIDAENQFGIANGSILNFKTTGPAAPTAPAAATRSVISVGTSTATFRGTVNPDGVAASYWFEYETAPFSSGVTPQSTSPQAVPGNSESTSPTAVSTDVAGLSTGTTYYVRVASQNSAGTGSGDQVVFTTK